METEFLDDCLSPDDVGIFFDGLERDLLIFLLKKKIKGWQWALSEGKMDTNKAEGKIGLAHGILTKIENYKPTPV